MFIPLETDWLLQTLHSPVNLFNDLPTFDQMVERCKRLGYTVLEFDCRQFKSSEDIYNAILHGTGDMGADYYYKNIMPIQFWDLLTVPWRQNSVKCLMAFRYFDTFHAVDPECAEDLMQILAGQNYHALRHGAYFLVCAYCENKAFQLKPVLVEEARFVSPRDFSEAADLRFEKGKVAQEWWGNLMQQVQSQTQTEKSFSSVASDIKRELGLQDMIQLHEASPTLEDVVQLVEELEQADAWWKAIVEQLSLDSQMPKSFGAVQVAIQRKKGRGSLLALYKAGLSPDDAAEIIQEAVAEQRERHRQSPGHLDQLWTEKVVELFNAAAEISRTRYQICEELDSLTTPEAKVPNRLNSTSEWVVEQLLKLAPEDWKPEWPKSGIVKIEDKDKEL